MKGIISVLPKAITSHMALSPLKDASCGNRTHTKVPVGERVLELRSAGFCLPRHCSERFSSPVLCPFPPLFHHGLSYWPTSEKDYPANLPGFYLP